MRHGIHFDIHGAHEAAHLEPLRDRLRDVTAGDATVASVAVSAASRVPVKEAWNVQVFHGLGDKGYTLNPIFLQRGRFPRLRTALNIGLGKLRIPGPFLRPPGRPGARKSRYQQLNAYGPYFHDRLQDMLKDAAITSFGHVALNELGPVQIDRDGPLLWLPTWDNRLFMGGRPQSSLAPFAHEVALVSRHVPVQVKYHPLTLTHEQDGMARAELAAAPGVDVISTDASPYALLDGVRGILTDSSSIGFEAYCLGLPVALAKPHRATYHGLHAELAERVPVMSSGKPDLLAWAEDPTPPRDRAWREDLLYTPSSANNDAFAADLRSRV